MSTAHRTSRFRFGLASAVVLASASVACLLIAVLGSRFHLRWDATGAGQFTLSQRTRAALERVVQPTTIVVSADLSALDQAARRRMADLLFELSRACPRIRSTWIDTSSATASSDLGRLLASLVEPIAPDLDRQREALLDAARGARSSAEGMRALSDALKSLAEEADASGSPLSTGRTNPRDQAGLVRTIAASLDAAAEAIDDAARHSVAGVPLPAVDAAKDAASEPLEKAARAAGAVAEYADAVLAQNPPAAVASAARTLRSLASAERDAAARSADVLVQLKRSDPLIVARVLEQTNTVLVASARGTIALDFATLFPAASAGGTPGSADVLFAGEQMIATALSALTHPVAPIAVFVHAQAASLLDERGEPTPAARAAFARLFERMRLTMTTPAEWAVVSRPLRPELSTLDPTGDRPVVWIVLPAPARMAGDARAAGAHADRTARVRSLAQAVETLITSGEHVLLCVEPSDLPSLGEPDPIADASAALGIKVDSGRPILRSESSPQGRLTWTFQVVTPSRGNHPISHAVAGLRIVLPWASPIELHPPAGTRAWPLLSLEQAEGGWGEANWFALRDVVARGLARPLTPILLADPPTLDPSRDAAAPTDGFIVAAAAERQRPAASTPRRAQERSPQRIVVVSSPEWLHDGYSQASESVSGRRVPLFPGNLELFEASLAWLACLDDQIAPGPQAFTVPTIQPIPDGLLLPIRVLLIVGLPVLVLITGGLLRIVRG